VTVYQANWDQVKQFRNESPFGKHALFFDIVGTCTTPGDQGTCSVDADSLPQMLYDKRFPFQNPQRFNVCQDDAPLDGTPDDNCSLGFALGSPSHLEPYTMRLTLVQEASGGLPDKVENHVAAPVGGSFTEILNTWDEPFDGFDPITGYQIERKLGGEPVTAFVAIVPNTGSTVTSFLDQGLVVDQSYSYRIAAINAFGVGPDGDVINTSTFEGEIGKPFPPIDLSAIAVSNFQINLSWLPGNNNGSIVTSYQIERAVNTPSPSWSIIVETGTSATTFSDGPVPALAKNTEYIYRVSARNQVGLSVDPSVTAIASTQDDNVPLAPDLAITATDITFTSLSIDWLPPADVGPVPGDGGDPITDYEIQRQKTSEPGTFVTIGNTGTAFTGFNDVGLEAGVSYDYKVRAINLVVIITGTPGAFSNVETFTTMDPGLEVMSATFIQGYLNGGKDGTKHVNFDIFFESDTNAPVEGIAVDAQIFRNGNPVSSIIVEKNGSLLTDVNGIITFQKANAPPGVYTIEILTATKTGSIWDLVTPVNSFTK